MIDKDKEGLERQLAAEFFANIGVAWFAAGVITLFFGGVNTFAEAVKSLTWGIGMSGAFLWFGRIVVRSKRL